MCFDILQGTTFEKEHLFEKTIVGFLKNQGFSIDDIKKAYRHKIVFDKSFVLTDEIYNNIQTINCETIKNNHKTVKSLCGSCEYSSKLTDNEKTKTPINISEEILMNLAQQYPAVLNAIIPDKLVAIGQKENRETRIYKEFYNYLINKNSVTDKKVLNVVKAIYENNERNKKDIDIRKIKEKQLTNYLKDENIPEIMKLIDKSIKENQLPKQINLTNNNQYKTALLKNPITILSSEGEYAKNLLKSKYMSLEVQDTGYHVFGDIDITQPYTILISNNTIDLITKIATNNRIRVISKNIDVRNHFIKHHNLQVVKTVPLDIICSAANISMDDLEFKDYIEQYKKIEKRMGNSLKPALSYITLSTRTSKEIDIQRTGEGFYHTQIKEKKIRKDECIFEVNIEKFIKNMRRGGITYKDIYHQIAIAINKQNERKVTFEIIELSEIFRISCKNDNTTRHRVHELLIHTFKQAKRNLSQHDSAYIRIKIYT